MLCRRFLPFGEPLVLLLLLLLASAVLVGCSPPGGPVSSAVTIS
jgi:hypothetical protein